MGGEQGELIGLPWTGILYCLRKEKIISRVLGYHSICNKKNIKNWPTIKQKNDMGERCEYTLKVILNMEITDKTFPIYNLMNSEIFY